MAISQEPIAPNKRAGATVEEEVAASITGLAPAVDDNDHYDLVATSAVYPTLDTPFVGSCVINRDEVVEVKSALLAYDDGARGRWYFRRNQHEALLAMGGYYCLCVCEDADTEDDTDTDSGDIGREVVATKFIPASLVDELLGDWLSSGPGRGPNAKLCWSHLFDSSEISEVAE